jgi:hypothetical protein
MDDTEKMDQRIPLMLSKRVKDHLQSVVRSLPGRGKNMSDVLRECFLEKYPLPETAAEPSRATPARLKAKAS